jgi:hypothetical protein
MILDKAQVIIIIIILYKLLFIIFSGSAAQCGP